MLLFFKKSFRGEKYLFQVLKNVFGLGLFQITKGCRKFGVKGTLKWGALNNKRRGDLLDFFTRNRKQLKEDSLRHDLLEKRKALLFSKSFRSARLKSGLPVRGQRTRTNKKTSKKLNKLDIHF